MLTGCFVCDSMLERSVGSRSGSLVSSGVSVHGYGVFL